MTTIDIFRKQNKVIDGILEGRIAEVFPELSELVFASRLGDYMSSFENLETTYKNILRYSFGRTRDPQRDVVYLKFKRDLIELCDNVSHHLLNHSDIWLVSLHKQDESFLHLNERERTELVDHLATEKEFNQLLSELGQSEKPDEKSMANYYLMLDKFFEVLWIKGNYGEGERLLAQRLIQSAAIPWQDKALIVSAVSLSLFNHFDPVKMDLLFDVYAEGKYQLSQRSLVGIIFALLGYHKRLILYPEVISRLKTVEQPSLLAKHTEQILIQFIKARETEKVTEKIQREILPEVMKVKPGIEDRLRLDEMLGKDDIEGRNPDWENFFANSPEVFKKLEEFSSMQMDGSDVFMGAFSMLKRFGFFEKTSNWFLPFYKDHPEIRKSLSGADEKYDWKSFFEGVENAPLMCNSDKYSFCFNLGFMPAMQKSMMLDMFSSELQQMNELSEDQKKHDAHAASRIVFIQYIQDLYRFFKLHPGRKVFTDIFSINPNIVEIDFLIEIFFHTKGLRALGEFYFTKNYYSEALKIFGFLEKREPSFELIEKIGFCYQMLGQYEQAIEKYKQGEIYDNNRAWLQKKIGFCFRKTGQYDKAIEYYKKVEFHEPENLEVQTFLGQLHIDNQDYDEALKYYFKVDYLKPNTAKVLRPIGWCSFLLHKTDQAIRYLKKVADSEGQGFDHLNLGHAYWAGAKLPEAIEQYRMALRFSGNDISWFKNAMNQDALNLKTYGIEELEVSLMVDYILLDI